MNKENKFKIGIALQNIALSLDSENFEKIRDRLETISEIIENEPDTEAWEVSKCKNCEYLDMTAPRTAVGYYCTAPKEWPHDISAWKQPTARACKKYFKGRKKP